MAEKKLYGVFFGPYLYEDDAALGDPDGDFVGFTWDASISDGFHVCAGVRYLDSDQTNFLTITWNEDDDTNRTLGFLVGGGNRTLTLNENLAVADGYNVSLQALGQANALVMNESFTIGNGSAGTLTYGSVCTLTVELTSIVNQDLTTDAVVTFAGVTLPNAGWIGIGAALERLNFYTAGYAAFMGCDVGFGVASPNEKVEIDGKLRLSGTSYSLIANHVSAGREILLIRAKSTASDGAGINVFGDADSTYPGEIRFISDTYTALVVDGYNVDVAGHDAATVGLKLGGVLVTASAAKLNQLAGVATFSTLVVNSQTVADDARALSSICKLVTNAKSDGIAGYFEGHIDGITDGVTYAVGCWLNIDSGSTIGADVRALDIGIYESGADCSGGNAYGLAIHMEFDDTTPPAAIYPFRLNTNQAAGHATPDALIFAANKKALGVVEADPGTPDDAYLKIVVQDGTVYRIPLVKE